MEGQEPDPLLPTSARDRQVDLCKEGRRLQPPGRVVGSLQELALAVGVACWSQHVAGQPLLRWCNAGSGTKTKGGWGSLINQSPALHPPCVLLGNRLFSPAAGLLYVESRPEFCFACCSSGLLWLLVSWIPTWCLSRRDTLSLP